MLHAARAAWRSATLGLQVRGGRQRPPPGGACCSSSPAARASRACPSSRGSRGHSAPCSWTIAWSCSISAAPAPPRSAARPSSRRWAPRICTHPRPPPCAPAAGRSAPAEPLRHGRRRRRPRAAPARAGREPLDARRRLVRHLRRRAVRPRASGSRRPARPRLGRAPQRRLRLVPLELRAVGRVLRAVCGTTACGGDLAASCAGATTARSSSARSPR